MSQTIKDNIDIFHENGLYYPRRTVTIFGEVDQDLAFAVFKNLHALDYTTGTINVVINCEGGDITQGKAIYDAIKGCKNHVRGIVYGQAASAASFILQAVDERICTPNSQIMVHVGSESLSDNHPRNIDTAYHSMREDEKWLENVYLEKIKEKYPKYTRQKVKTMLTFDKYLTPKEALNLNLIDLIGESL